MLNFRIRKIMLFISVFTVLFVIYQLSQSEPSNGTSKEALLRKEIDRSLQQDFEGRFHNDVNFDSDKAHVQQSFKNKDTESGGQYSMTSKSLPPLFGGQKIVHIDLKGAPLKVTYYKEFFPLIKSLGATGLLMEYEDMFPYTNADIPASNAYSRSDIKSILKLATENNLEIIPLVQTFGHLEFVLKLKEFEHLREVPTYPQVICPSRNGTSQLLFGMIDDIISLHPDSRYIHIGCDEVYNLAECSYCLDVLLKRNWTKQQLFLSHVTALARYIKEKYPVVKPLMWDDEFRKMSVQELLASNVGPLVEPVVWKYTPAIDTYLPEEIWDKYATVFGSVWIASAFKGATGPDKIVTDINYHLENHRSWMRLVTTYAERVTFKGIMITGWQRYDHFSVLCELLPVGLPSLAVSLTYLAQNDLEMLRVPRAVLDNLKCGPGLLHPRMGARCSFPGSTVYEKAHQLLALLDQIAQIEDTSEAKGWLTQYNIHMGFSSPAHVEGATSDVDRFKMELIYLEQDLCRAMSEIFLPDTDKEWVETYIAPVNKRLQAMWDAREKLLAAKTWPRRPLYDRGL